MKITAFFFLLVLLHSCTYDKYEVPEPALADTTGQAAINPCDSLNVTYSGTVKPLTDNNCALSGCHAAGSGNGDFTSYAGLKAKVDNGTFKKRVIEDKTMPPSGPLPASDIEKLQCWLNAGAPEN